MCKVMNGTEPGWRRQSRGKFLESQGRVVASLFPSIAIACWAKWFEAADTAVGIHSMHGMAVGGKGGRSELESRPPV